MTVRNIFALLAAAGLVLAAEAAGLWTMGGISHPWWSSPAVIKGVAIGIFVAGLLFWLIGKGRLGWRTTVAILLAVALICAVATGYGRFVFVGSEDFVPWAGRLWHFGFIGVNATLVAVFWAVFSRFSNR